MAKRYLFLLFPLFVSGQTLQELVSLSLENQLIESSKQSVASVEDKYSSIQRGYLPSFSIGSTYSKANKDTSTTADNSITNYAKVDFVVYDGGKREATFDSLQSSVSRAELNLNSLKNRVSLDVINYYYNYLSLVAQKEATQKEIEQLHAQYERLTRFLDVGVTTSDEVDKISSRVENSNLTLHQIELDIQTVLHHLEYITSNVVSITSGSTMKALEDNEKQIRDDIKALEYQVEALLSDAKAQKSGYYPTLSVDNTYNTYDMNYNNKSYENDFDEQNILKVNLSWNIFEFGATKKSYESKYKEYKSLESQYKYEKNKANTDLRLALRAYDIAKLKINTSKAALKAASSTYETIEAKYKNGLVDNVAYLEALSEKYSALSSVKSAEYDLEIKKANIIYHSGKNVWEYIQ